MDAVTYAAVVDVCARLAGRMSDVALGAARDFYSVGEWDLAEGTLLVNLEYEGVTLTREERELIRSTLEDPDAPELAAVAVIEAVPPPRYRFAPAAPAGAPDPAPADRILSADAPLHGGRLLRRTWREPCSGARDAAGWVYVLEVAAGADALSAACGLGSRLSTLPCESRCVLEAVAERRPLPPYQAAAVAAARVVWAA
ncbi:hypothetical protein ACFO4E_26685 [Nocardiopsis mangrovi]|uniref:Uncharacterized protein n=1 Tax=Nocardiopsis mangrovi TaxID=1179818 RepID=A0ABV9E2Q7_9ACTN